MSLSLIQSFYFVGIGYHSYPMAVWFFFSLNRHSPLILTGYLLLFPDPLGGLILQQGWFLEMGFFLKKACWGVRQEELQIPFIKRVSNLSCFCKNGAVGFQVSLQCWAYLNLCYLVCWIKPISVWSLWLRPELGFSLSMKSLCGSGLRGTFGTIKAQSIQSLT